MRFSDKLTKQRKNNNFSQEQFANKMKVSRQAISKWESGSSYPDMDKIIQMCKILNCNLDDLLDDGIIDSKETNLFKIGELNLFPFYKIVKKLLKLYNH